MAKLIPAESPSVVPSVSRPVAIATFMPTSSPEEFIRGPPEFPGFTAASVWMKFVNPPNSLALAGSRPSPLTMPSLMLNLNPNGEPNAYTR